MHYEAICELEGLEGGKQHLLLQIDVYSVEFRQWVWNHYPFVDLVYVPG